MWRYLGFQNFFLCSPNPADKSSKPLTTPHTHMHAHTKGGPIKMEPSSFMVRIWLKFCHNFWNLVVTVSKWRVCVRRRVGIRNNFWRNFRTRYEVERILNACWRKSIVGYAIPVRRRVKAVTIHTLRPNATNVRVVQELIFIQKDKPQTQHKSQKSMWYYVID